MTHAASSSLHIAIIGAGPAGLFAAEQLGKQGHQVHIYDHMARPGRKFLMAGRSGLNLTHNEPFEGFISRYAAASTWLEPALTAFPPTALRHWAEELGHECFVGSSGKVFLKDYKASPLLRSWLQRLQGLSVQFHPRHRLKALNGLELTFQTPRGEQTHKAVAIILALGGSSWARLGSDGQWAQLLSEHCASFAPSNCGFMPDWPMEFLTRHEGATLRGVSLTYAGQTKRGDLIITPRGIEGAPLYALSPLLREKLTTEHATLTLNLRPTLSIEQITARLAQQRLRESRSNKLRKAFKLDKPARELLNLLAPEARTVSELTSAITALPLTLTAPAALDRAISTAGGVRQTSLNDAYMFHHQPGLFACGEMLDWEAPTGGYLLQGCFSTAYVCAKGVHHWLSASLPGKIES